MLAYSFILPACEFVTRDTETEKEYKNSRVVQMLEFGSTTYQQCIMNWTQS